MKRSCILAKYTGCLVGGVVGDCLGAPYENTKVISLNQLKKDFVTIDKPKMKLLQYTDDTAMARSVARSLIADHKDGDKREVVQKNLAQRFTEEYFADPNRGYDYNIGNVFSSLLDEDYENPTGPAAQQFDGIGSYGNGGAMRVAPAALYGEGLLADAFNKLVQEVTVVTHSHRDAINGAILIAKAIQAVLKLNPVEKLDCEAFIENLHSEMKTLELPDTTGGASQQMPYCSKLEKIKELLSEDACTSTIVESLGNDVSALGSVPAAIYVFLRGQNPVVGIDRANAFERIILLAISLGGDTDTIATMAGALAGAYYGIESIGYHWQNCCEGLADAKEFAQQLFDINYGKDQD